MVEIRMHWEQILIIVKFCKMKAVGELSWNIHSSSRTCGDDSVKGDYPWMYIGELDFFNLIIFYINTKHVGRNEGKMIHVILSFYSNAHFVHIWVSPCQSLISWDVRSHESQLVKILLHPPTINQVMKFPHALLNCCISAQGSKLTDWQVLSLYVVLYGEGNPIFENLFKNDFVFEQISFLTVTTFSFYNHLFPNDLGETQR